MSPPSLNRVEIELHLKNMVSKSCVHIVRQQVESFDDVNIISLRIGKLILDAPAPEFDVIELEEKLKEVGFPTILNAEQRIVEQIKIASIELVHQAYNSNSLIRNSDYLARKLEIPYPKLSKIFSDETGATLEQYLIYLKVEKIKELITYDEHSMSEIAFMMGYSSVQYLSTQFKKATGITPSEYKKLEEKPRIPLEDVIQYYQAS